MPVRWRTGVAGAAIVPRMVPSDVADGPGAVPVSMPLSELAARLSSPAAAEELSPLAGVSCVLAEVDAPQGGSAGVPPPCPVVAVATAPAPPLVDAVAPSPEEAERVVDAVCRQPVAAAVLVQLLRHNERASVADALFAESLGYSALQHGAGFRRWLAARGKGSAAGPGSAEPLVLLERVDARLRITLNRPDKRNAYSAGLRDGLCEALTLAAWDPSIERVVLQGAGKCFSAGGDLAEFGDARDAAVAHASRMTRSAAALLHRLRHRVEARLHGACIGAGIELPAFAARVVARQDAFFELPEVGMGLIPGAGGTASILPRIGRQRLAYMALSGARVDAATALAWGLVDAVGEWA